MKSLLFFFLIPFYGCTNGGAITSLPDSISDEDVEVELISTTSTSTSTTTPSSRDNYLDNISIQDVLSSDIDASEKIEKKIINAVTEYSSNCHVFKKIDLSTDGFTFPEDNVIVDLGIANGIFYNFRISERSSSSNEYKRKLYSTSIECDSLRMAKIEVKLPKNIEISAYLKVTKISNTNSDILNVGSISITLEGNALAKQFSIQTNTSLSANYEDNIISKILYSKSQVSLYIDTKYQMVIYNKLETLFNKVESPIRQYLIEKLDAKLVNNGISVADSCSKFINPEKSSKKVNLPFFNNNFNNLYVIPNAKLETWKGVDLSAGPIIIDGLSSFNSTELIVLQREPNSPDGPEGYYFTILPSPNDPETNVTTIRIKTNDLKGKIDWSYNSKQRSFPFTLEFIQFEVQRNQSFTYTRNTGGSRYDSSGRYRHYPYESYGRSSENKIDVNVHLGSIQIKSSKSSVCENENEFVHFVLSEYLKTVIADSLKNSLSKKLQNDSSYVTCT